MPPSRRPGGAARFAGAPYSALRLLVVTVGALSGCATPIGERAEAPPRPPATFVYLDSGEVAAVRVRLAAGDEPWRSALQQVLVEAGRLRRDTVTYTVVANGGPSRGHAFRTEAPYTKHDGVIDPDADRHDYQQAIAVAAAVRTLALGWTLTGDTTLAERALRLIEGWCAAPRTRMHPAYTNQQSRIELSITMPGLFYGMALLSRYPSWSDSSRTAAFGWVRRFAASARGWRARNNFENWRLVVLASAGALLSDTALLEEAFVTWRALIPRQMDPDGFLVEETGRANGLTYSLYALNAMTQVAEIARHHGVDLYGFRTGDGRGLELALDRHARHLLEPSSWPHPQRDTLEAPSAAAFELALLWQAKPAYEQVLTRFGRPLAEPRVMGPVTLTHARGAYPWRVTGAVIRPAPPQAQ